MLAICPSTDYLKPCTCRLEEIRCGGNESYNLATIFQVLRLNTLDDNKRFVKFELTNTAIDVLEENTFKDILFNDISIHNCDNLTKIHKNAFSATTSYTQNIEIYNNSRLSQSEDNSLFEGLSKFVKIQSINLNSNNISEIPNNAFRPLYGYQNYLTTLSFANNPITRLGNNGFYYLNSLAKLDLQNASIDSIPNNAFNFEKTSQTLIQIELENNPLNNSSFSDFWFVGIKRPTHLLIGDSKVISYLNEKAFSLFLTTNENNEIVGNPDNQKIDCNYCSNKWILNNPDLLANIKQIVCSNGKKLTDHDNFQNCTKYYDFTY